MTTIHRSQSDAHLAMAPGWPSFPVRRSRAAGGVALMAIWAALAAGFLRATLGPAEAPRRPGLADDDASARTLSLCVCPEAVPAPDMAR
jgi:hypothetical protein